jgi:hypothetical protein
MEIVADQLREGSPAVRRKSPADRKAHGRSRVANSGGDLLPNVDGRSLIARRYREIADAILIDQGGAERCSESRVQLIRRFAAAAVMAEQMESKLAHGEEIDIQQHALLCSTLVRVGQRIGIDRVPRDLSPTLSELLCEDHARHMHQVGDAG